MAQTDTVPERKVEKQQPGDGQPAKLTADGPLASTDQMAAEWDAAFSSTSTHDYSKVSTELRTSALAAYAQGGSFALSQLEDSINAKVKAPGAGPVFVLSGNKIEIHNIQSIDSDTYSKLSADQQKSYRTVTSVSGEHQEFCTDVSPPLIFDKPENVGLNLKPGQQVSAEFPSEYIVAAAFHAGNMLNKDWVGANPEQQFLLSRLQSAAGELPKIPQGIIDAKAAIGDVEPVNQFLKDHGFDIKLNPIGPNDAAFAGTLSLKGQWAEPGANTTMKGADGNTYPAVLLPERDVKSYVQDGVNVAQLYNNDGITVYAAPAGNDPLASYQVTAMAADLTPSANTKAGDFNSVIIPKIDKNLSSDLTGLIGMRATDGTRISQAKMQTKLALDENGFDAEQGAAFAAGRGMLNSLVFDKPFIIWAVAKGCTQPLFATEVDQKYWKDPKQTPGK